LQSTAWQLEHSPELAGILHPEFCVLLIDYPHVLRLDINDTVQKEFGDKR
jgi:hypothetical protein